MHISATVHMTHLSSASNTYLFCSTYQQSATGCHLKIDPCKLHIKSHMINGLALPRVVSRQTKVQDYCAKSLNIQKTIHGQVKKKKFKLFTSPNKDD